MKPTIDCTEEEFDRTIAVNLTGVWLCMKYEIQQMLSQGGGAIVNTASAAGLVGFPGLPDYVASKHGVVGLTKTAALEYAKSGIRVNAVCPGVIQTPMVERGAQLSPGFDELAVSMEPVGRFGQPAEVGEAVVWLCSDAASFCDRYSDAGRRWPGSAVAEVDPMQIKGCPGRPCCLIAPDG